MAEAVALVLALATATGIDRLAARRGFDRPGFRDPSRRLVVGLGLALVLFLGIFYPMVTFGQRADVDLESVSPVQLFFSQLLLVGWLALWWRLGEEPGGRVPGGFHPGESESIEGGDAGRKPRSWRAQLGLSTRDVGTELSLGLAAGLVGWLGVLAAALLLSLVLTEIGGDALLNKAPAEQIVWLASLPVSLRLAVATAAGVVEELFFRGFLQPRIGIGGSTLLFVGAHLAYGDLFMLFGITCLSLFYAWLTVWRRSVWAAMAAHFLFDAIQLLVIIPSVLQATGGAAA